MIIKTTSNEVSEKVYNLYTRCFICNEKVQRQKIYCCINTADNTIKEIKNKKPIVCGKCVSNHSL